MPKQAFIIAFGVIIYLLVFHPSGAEAYAQGDLGYNSLTLPANTPVKLLFHEGLNSQKNREGDENKTVQEAFDSVAHPIDDTNITIEEMENYYYRISVLVSSDRTAEFSFQPFEEPYRQIHHP